MRTYLSEFWEHKDLTLSFAGRDINARYKQTALGAAWAVIQPLSAHGGLHARFSPVARFPPTASPIRLFVLGALIFWTFFATAVTQGTLAIVANSESGPEDLLSA